MIKFRRLMYEHLKMCIKHLSTVSIKKLLFCWEYLRLTSEMLRRVAANIFRDMSASLRNIGKYSLTTYLSISEDLNL